MEKRFNMLKSLRRRRRQGGNAIVEVALMSPWIFFLFVGVFDMGFYAFSVISVENAARAAATQTATSPTAATGPVGDTIACNAAWREMNLVPNIAAISQNCSQLPLIVVRRTLCNQGTVSPGTLTCEQPCYTPTPTPPCWPNPGDYCSGAAGANTIAASQVCVTYRSDNYIPIPGLLPSQLTLTRVAEMRILAK